MEDLGSRSASTTAEHDASAIIPLLLSCAKAHPNRGVKAGELPQPTAQDTQKIGVFTGACKGIKREWPRRLVHLSQTPVWESSVSGLVVSFI